MRELKTQLQSLLKGEVDDRREVLEAYSKDWSIFRVFPKLVVFPKDSEDIQKLVRFAREHLDLNLSLTCRSGGSDMTGGPLNDSIIVDVSRHLNQLIEIGQNYAFVQPGMFYRDFEKETLKHNLFLPSFPASRELCTVGGMVANNSGGENSLVYGKTEKYVEELKVVLSDGKEYTFRKLSRAELEQKMKLQNFEGEVYRGIFQIVDTEYELLQQAKPKVTKNSAGYALWNVWDRKTFDLTQLFVGSQGTLGIITEIKFRLIVPYAHSALLVIFLDDVSILPQLIMKIGEAHPESFESYDDKTLRLALRFLPDFVKLLGAKNIFSLAWQFLPEFNMMLSRGLPRLVLLAEFTAHSFQEAQQKAYGAREKIRAFNIPTRVTKDAHEVQKYFAIRRESFKLLHSHVKGMEAAPFIDDLIVRPEQLHEFLPQLEKILDQYRDTMIYTVAGHMGDANFHIIPLVNLADPKVRSLIPEITEKVYQLVFKFHGSITAEHNDGIIRTPYLKEMYGENVYQIFQAVKNIFDPHHLFNPRKKVGGDMEYFKNHIITTNE